MCIRDRELGIPVLRGYRGESGGRRGGECAERDRGGSAQYADFGELFYEELTRVLREYFTKIQRVVRGNILRSFNT